MPIFPPTLRPFGPAVKLTVDTAPAVAGSEGDVVQQARLRSMVAQPLNVTRTRSALPVFFPSRVAPANLRFPVERSPANVTPVGVMAAARILGVRLPTQTVTYRT